MESRRAHRGPAADVAGEQKHRQPAARIAGRNADQWQDVREFLPLLSQERWYTRTRRGYARGWEPVRYVENVQSYLNILEVAGIGAPAIASASGADPVPEQPAARAAR